MTEAIRKNWWLIHLSVVWAAVSTAFLYAADQYPEVQQQLADWLPDRWKWVVPFIGVGLGAVAAVLRQPIVALALSKLFKGDSDEPEK